MGDDQKRGTELVAFDAGRNLQVTDERVVAVSQAVRLSPATLIRRIEASLPNLVVRTLYLEVAGEMGLRPTTFGTVMDVLVEDVELSVEHFKDVSVGKNLVSSRGSRVVDEVEWVCELIELVRDSFGFSISYKRAAQVVTYYGRAASDLVESICEHLDEISELLQIHRGQDDVVFGLTLSRILQRLEQTHHSGPLPMSDIDIIAILEQEEEFAPSLPQRRTRR